MEMTSTEPIDHGAPQELAASDDPSEADFAAYPSTAKQIMAMTSVGTSIFLISLDRNILATATPSITNEFDSISQVGWYSSAYLLTMSAFMLLFGRIYTFYNPKVVFLSCIAIFEVGSAVCGSAPTSTAFIVGRAIAGIGGSAITGGGMVIMFVTVPLHRRPLFQSCLALVWGISSVAGPLLGGVLTSNLTWRWCFYVNLPIGGAVIVYLMFCLQIRAAPEAAWPIKQKLLSLDPLGTAVLIPCIVSLLLALDWGGNQYLWSDWRIILLLVIFALLIVAFVSIQLWKQENATVPPRIIGQRTIACASVGQFFMGGSVTVIVSYLPIWFQAIQQVNAVQSGLRFLPVNISLGVGSTMAGILVNRLGYYTPFMISGCAIMTIGAGLLSALQSAASTGQWLAYQIPFGFGLGMGLQQANLAAQTVLSRKDIGTGASLMIFMNTLGGSIFVSVAQGIFSNKLIAGLAKVPGLIPTLVISAGATELYENLPSDAYEAVRHYYNDAITQGVFYVVVATSAFAFMLALGMEWRDVRVKDSGGSTGEHSVQSEVEVTKA